MGYVCFLKKKKVIIIITSLFDKSHEIIKGKR